MEPFRPFNVRWNNYSTVMQSIFRKLFEGEQFVDVTLACEGQSIKCHRLILSACSTYFDRILKENPSSNLVIFLTTMKFWELKALVTFMYNGKGSLSPQKFRHLCKAAETLKVKGLALNDNDLTDGVMPRVDQGELDDSLNIKGKESPFQLQNSHRDGTIEHGQQHRSVLRQQHNNLSAYASEANRQPQQIRRKIPIQLPKPVKIRRVEKKSSNGNGSAVDGRGGNLNIPQLPVNQMAVKIPDAIKMARTSVSQVNENYEDEERDNVQHEATADSSINYICEVGGGEDHEELDSGDGNEALGSKEHDWQLGHRAEPHKSGMKYKKEVRDSTLAALQLTLRQCLDTYGISKRTMSKWISREKNQDVHEDEAPPSNMTMTNEGGGSMTVTGNLPPKRQPRVPSLHRAQRLRKASELAMTGFPVQKAAALFEIPRTTLSAYMKRNGLVANCNYDSTRSSSDLEQQNQREKSSEASSSAETNDQGGENSSVNFGVLDFPFPFLGISQAIEEMSKERHENENYSSSEEEED